MSYQFFIKQNINKLLSCVFNNIFTDSFCFFIFSIIYINLKKCIFPFNQTNSLIIFHLTNYFFVDRIKKPLISWITTKIKQIFVYIKIFINIFHFNFINLTVCVCEQQLGIVFCFDVFVMKLIHS